MSCHFEKLKHFNNSLGHMKEKRLFIFLRILLHYNIVFRIVHRKKIGNYIEYLISRMYLYFNIYCFENELSSATEGTQVFAFVSIHTGIYIHNSRVHSSRVYFYKISSVRLIRGSDKISENKFEFGTNSTRD